MAPQFKKKNVICLFQLKMIKKRYQPIVVVKENKNKQIRNSMEELYSFSKIEHQELIKKFPPKKQTSHPRLTPISPLSAIPPTKSPKNCDFPASLPLFSLSMQEVKNGFFPTENFKLCYYILYAHKNNNNNKYPKNVSILLWLNNHEHQVQINVTSV